MVNLTGKQKQDYERLLKLQKRAMCSPNQLVKLSAGNYYFYSKLENELLIVSDDSYENGGSPCWVVRQEKDHNVVNDYPTLKEFKKDWAK
jgi:hypothetical protein